MDAMSDRHEMQRPAPGQAGAQVRRAFPELRIKGLEFLGGGFANLVFVSDDVVVRVARTAAVATAQRCQLELLPRLDEALPVAVPVPLAYSEPGAVFGYGALALRRLEGTPARALDAQTRRFATAMAEVLTTLHDIPLGTVEPPLSAVGLDTAEGREALMNVIWPRLGAELSPGEFGRVTAWWQEASNDGDWRRFDRTLRHGDLWFGNTLVDDHGSLIGVVDWDRLGVGDPALDLALQRHAGVECEQTVLDRYRLRGAPLDLATRRRMQRYWELREFDGIAQAVMMNDEMELRDSLGKLRAGPVLARSR